MVSLNRDNFHVPPPNVLAWCRNLVTAAAENAIWGIPRSGTTFRIEKAQKRLVLVIEGNDNDDDFKATKHVFSFIGWRVVRESDDEDE